MGTVEVDGKKVDESEVGDAILAAYGCKSFFIHVPEREYYLFEYGVQLPDTDENKALIRKSIEKTYPDMPYAEKKKKFDSARSQCMVSKDGKMKVPGGLITNLIEKAMSDLPGDAILTTQEMIKVFKNRLKKELELLERNGVCTLALAHKIYINTEESQNYGENEHETVQSVDGSSGSSE